MVKLQAPPGSGGCSFDGEEYAVAEDGTVEVPEEAAEALSDHGFIRKGEGTPDEQECVGEYTIKSQGFGKWKILHCEEEIAKGLTKADAEAKVAELNASAAPVEVPEEAAAPVE